MSTNVQRHPLRSRSASMPVGLLSRWTHLGLWPLALVGSVASAAWALRLVPAQAVWDSEGYVHAALLVRQNGVFSSWDGANLRTYGYPLFLSKVMPLTTDLHRFSLDLRPAVFLVQWVLLVLVSLLLALSLTTSRWLRPLLFAAVAANPLVVLHTAEILTDSLATTCALFVAAALIRAGRATGLRRVLWLLAAGATAGFAVEVRPAAVVCLVAFLCSLGWLLARNGRSWGWATACVLGLASLAAVIVPLAVQVHLNHLLFSSWSFAPVADLGNIQTSAAVRAIRYGTNISGCVQPQLYFGNHFDPGLGNTVSTEQALSFYLGSWPGGPYTMAMHVFSGLDPHPFPTFVTNFHAWWEHILQVFTVVLLALAAVPLALAARSREGRRVVVSAVRGVAPGHLYIALLILGNIALLGYSATEYRFGLPVVAVVSLLAVVGSRAIVTSGRRAAVGLALTIVVAAPLWIWLSAYAVSTSPVWAHCS